MVDAQFGSKRPRHVARCKMSGVIVAFGLDLASNLGSGCRSSIPAPYEKNDLLEIFSRLWSPDCFAIRAEFWG